MPEFELLIGDKASDFARWDDLDFFTRGYIEAAFFTETGADNEPEGLGDDSCFGDIEPSSLAGVIADCAAFQMLPAYRAWMAWLESEAFEDWKASSQFAHIRYADSLDMERGAGRDYWFTRNGHGVGFWEGESDGYPEPHDSALSNAAKAAGEVYLVRGDDGLIYFQ